MHRSGRTGRAGRPGVAVTLYAENEVRDIRKIEQGIGQGFRFERGAVPSAEQVMSLAGTVAREQIKGVSDEMVEFFRESAQELLEEEESEVREGPEGGGWRAGAHGGAWPAGRVCSRERSLNLTFVPPLFDLCLAFCFTPTRGLRGAM